MCTQSVMLTDTSACEGSLCGGKSYRYAVPTSSFLDPHLQATHNLCGSRKVQRPTVAVKHFAEHESFILLFSIVPIFGLTSEEGGTVDYRDRPEFLFGSGTLPATNWRSFPPSDYREISRVCTCCNGRRLCV